MHEQPERKVETIRARGHRTLVAGVIRPGERGWYAPRGADDAADDLTIFEIGSITKAFTGVLLADMTLRHEVSLDDPLSRHLPGRRPRWRHGEPTLLELATHRSGLPNVPRAMRRRELAYARFRREGPLGGGDRGHV